MLIKKIGSLLLALTLVIACVPGTLASAEGTPWFDIEVENGTCVNSKTLLKRTENDRTFMYRIQGTDSETATTSTFAAPAAGTYDIWAVVGGAPNHTNLCNYVFKIGDEEIYNTNAKTAYNNRTGDVLWTTAQQVAAGVPMSMVWVKIGTETLTAADTTLTAEIGNNGSQLALGMIDMVRFVPSSWNWTPASNFDDPIKPKYIVTQVEGEAATTYDSTYFRIVNSASACGGAALVTNYSNSHTSSSVSLGFTNVTVSETTNYDMWILAPNNIYNHGPWTATINGASYKQNMAIKGSISGTLTSCDTVTSYYPTMSWQILGSEIPLTAGTAYTIDMTNSTVWSSTRVMQVVDAIRLVPSDACWKGDTDGTLNGAMVYSYAEERADGAIILEAEEAAVSQHMTITDNANASGAKYVSTSSGGYIKDNVTLAADGTYDVWAIMCYYDTTHSPNGTHYGSFIVDIGSEEVYNKNHGSHTVVGDNLYSVSMPPQSLPSEMRWVKVSENQQLTAGDNLIRTEVGKCTNDNKWGILDAIVLVPANWNWTPANSVSVTAPEVLYNFTLGDKTAGATITATATAKKTVDAEKTAVVIVAVYQGDVLVSVAPSAVTTLTTEDQTISANVTLPADVSNVDVKAFLWDGLAAGNAYCLPLEK